MRSEEAGVFIHQLQNWLEAIWWLGGNGPPTTAVLPHALVKHTPEAPRGSQKQAISMSSNSESWGDPDSGIDTLCGTV